MGRSRDQRTAGGGVLLPQGLIGRRPTVSSVNHPSVNHPSVPSARPQWPGFFVGLVLVGLRHPWPSPVDARGSALPDPAAVLLQGPAHGGPGRILPGRRRQQLVQLRWGEHQCITAQRQLLERPLPVTAGLRFLCLGVDQQQIQIAADAGLTPSLAAVHTHLLQRRAMLGLVVRPLLDRLQDNLGLRPSQQRLRQRAHGHG